MRQNRQLNTSKKKSRPFFKLSKKEKIFDEAKESISSKKKLGDVVSKSTEKLKKLATDSTEWKELKSKANTLVQMVQSHLAGDYRAFSNASLLLIVFALIYFITPTDVIPDFIPALGFTDDASVLYLVYRKLSKDIEAFQEWKNRDSEKA